MNRDKMISVIIPVYNTEKFLKKCIDSVLNQSYRNLEVIVVNDCSPGNCSEIIKDYQIKDSRVKLIEHEVNKGLFQARITGSDAATGDYIVFLDSDDYISADFYRTLLFEALKNEVDIVMGNFVLVYDDGSQNIYNYFNDKHLDLKGNEVLDEYFKQEGLSFDWHTMANKLYSKAIWDKARPHYNKIDKHLIMTEDFSFSTVLFYYAKSLVKVNNDSNVIFYCQHSSASTAVDNIKFGKVKKNLTDLITSFTFVQEFLEEVGVYEKYREQFSKWKTLYYTQHKSYVLTSKLSKEEKEKAKELLHEFCPNPIKLRNESFIYSIATPWNDSLEKVKLKIADSKYEYISFDIFDTLIVRPFLRPSDMFVFLDEEFRTISGISTGLNFSKMRVLSEQIAREEKINSKCQDITLDEIYDTMQRIYDSDESTIKKMKQKEIELELKFCTRRDIGYELLTYAIECGKKIVCTSDMYLSLDTISKILSKNGYEGISNTFVSSEHRISKANGDLYTFVLENLSVSSDKILHIGDNKDSDFIMAKKKKIDAIYLPKAIDVATDKKIVNNLLGMFTDPMPILRDNCAAMQFVGIRTMVAMVVNKYFDNPYKTFYEWSDFNSDPYLVGYFALGMYLFGITDWILKDVSHKGYSKLVFMARDGYLPMQAYKIMKHLYKNAPLEDYVYVSRKSLVPVTLLEKSDFYRLSDVISVANHTPRQVLKYIEMCINIEDKDVSEILKSNDIDIDKNIGDQTAFNKFIKVVLDNFYDPKKHKKTISCLKNYFESFYSKNSATFDVGYSGRPELYLSRLLNMPIDTYFLNINSDEALTNSKLGNYDLNVFFESKPAVTGFTYETMLSSLEPSCIGYNFDKDKIDPIFEEDKKDYPEKFMMSIMQQAALEFIKDMVDVFGEDIDKLYYQKEYTTLPIMSYINSSLEIDKNIFNSISFEDDVRLNDSVNMVKEWSKEVNNKNQRPLYEMVSKSSFGNYSVLDNKSRPFRVLYYMIYDRQEFKNKIKSRLKNHPTMLKISKKSYGMLRNVKNTIKGSNKKNK